MKPFGKSLLKTSLIKPLIDALFPSYCLLCGRRLPVERKDLCSTCLSSLPRTPSDFDFYDAAERLKGLVPFAEYHSDLLFSKHNGVRTLLHWIKYRERPELAYRLALYYGKFHREQGHFSDSTLIIPVPLTPSRYRQRGFNQSHYIARGLSEALKIPYRTDLLFRKEKKGSQTLRNKESRWMSMDGLFYLKSPEELARKRILLCDDLLTTGSTLYHAASPLLKAPEAVESLSFYTLFADYMV